MSARGMDGITWVLADTVDGQFMLGYSAKGLCSVTFPEHAGQHPVSATTDAQVKSWHDVAVRALADALGGRPVRALPPLDFSSGTSFQQSVWKALMGIAPGRTSNYGNIAKEIGNPGASRAVGAACGANPIPVFVPCHRVLAANRELGGFSGGLHWKQRLLAREGAWPGQVK